MSKQEKNKRAADARGSSFVAPLALSNGQCLGVLVLLVAVFFHKILLGQAYFWEDFLYQNYPFRSFAATSLAAGELPLWNPYTFNGMPFLADIQTTVLYFPCLFLTLFVNDGSLSYYWLEVMIILHFVLAGVGMFSLAKSYSLSNAPSLFAGAAYMLSGYMIVHAIHQQNLTLVAWYPLVLLFFRKAMNESGWFSVFLCALTLGHSILAGYPQLSLYLYCFLGVYFVFELLTTFRFRELLSKPVLILSAKAASIVVPSVALAMIQLLPTLELSELSQRAQITFEKASEGSLAFAQLATLMFPKLYGTAGANGYAYFGPGTYWWFWETCIYLGALPLVLAVLSFTLVKKNKHIAFFAGIAVFSLLFALGDNFVLWKLFYEFVPGFSKFRIPARMGILLTFSGALLSAFALQWLLHEEKSRKERSVARNTLLAAAGVATLLLFLILSGSFSGSLDAQQYQQVASDVRSSSIVSFFLLTFSCALVFLVMKGKITRLAPVALVVVFFIDMFVFGESQNTGATNPTAYFKQSAELVSFFKKEGEKEIFRINTRNAQGMIMDRNQGMMDRIFMMEGYTPLALQRAYAPLASNDVAHDLLNVKYKTVSTEQGQRLAEHPTYMPRAFFLYDVKVILDSAEFVRYLKSPEFNHRKTAVLERQPGFSLPMPLTEPQWDARITEYRNNRIALDVSTSHDGLLVLSEIFYPGWKAYVDGVETEVYQTDYNLRGVFVKSGKHAVVMTFEPASFRSGMWISLVSLSIILIGIVLGSVLSWRRNTVSFAFPR
jgi:hypothetical protein